MRRYLIAAALLALALPTVATAKGPVSAFISGPGLQRGLEISGDGKRRGRHWATSRTRAASSHRCSGSPRPDVRDSAKWQARLEVQGGLRASPTERHLESRRPARLSLCAAACAHVHEAGAGVLRHRAESRGWYRASPALKRMLVRAGLAAKLPCERLRVRALRPTRVAVLEGGGAAPSDRRASGGFRFRNPRARGCSDAPACDRACAAGRYDRARRGHVCGRKRRAPEKHDITIRGVDRNAVVLDGADQRMNGIVVHADGVSILNMSAHNFLRNAFSGGGRGPLPRFLPRYGTSGSRWTTSRTASRA